MMNGYPDRIEPWVIGENGEASPDTLLGSESNFERSLSGSDGLEAHVQSHHDAVRAELGLD